VLMQGNKDNYDHVEAFKQQLNYLKECYYNEDTLDDVVEVLHWKNTRYEDVSDIEDYSCGDGEEAAVVKLSNGTYGVLEAWEDYTGHG